ncbi:hypothetical protein CFP56_043664, partial [Quercus suber]
HSLHSPYFFLDEDILPTAENLTLLWSLLILCSKIQGLNFTGWIGGQLNNLHHLKHLDFLCPFAQNVWAMFKGRVQKCRNEATDFFLLFKQMQQKHSQLELESWATTA